VRARERETEGEVPTATERACECRVVGFCVKEIFADSCRYWAVAGCGAILPFPGVVCEPEPVTTSYARNIMLVLRPGLLFARVTAARGAVRVSLVAMMLAQSSGTFCLEKTLASPTASKTSKASLDLH